MGRKSTGKKVKLLGVYDYTVWLTYFGLFISIVGMMEGLRGRRTNAVFCLAFSGLCDAFDGRIARKKTDRTEDEKAFGIQIDSLCDIVCFGVFPSVICFTLGVNGAAGMLVIAWYCICGVIRLAQFNVTAQGRSGETEEKFCYRGLPITSASVVLPVMCLVGTRIPAGIFVLLLHFILAAMGLLFVLDLPFPTLKRKGLAFFVAIVAAALFLLLAWEGWGC
jgi:CDP-diacylglycerol--serine O-phosphatidyltransferase